MHSARRLLHLIAAAALSVALLPFATPPAAAQEASCAPELGGIALREELPDDQGDVQVLRCRYGPADGNSLVKLAARWNPPGTEPTLEGGCGGVGRRTEDAEENTITGTLFSGTAMARVVWDVGNTRRAYDEDAIVAAAEALLAVVEPLGQACPDPIVGEATVADECAAELGLLGLTRSVRSQDSPDEVSIKCFYDGTAVTSTVQYFMNWNPLEAQPAEPISCGRAPSGTEQDGSLSGVVYAPAWAARVRYVIEDTSLGYDQGEVIAGAETLLTTISDEAMACEAAASPPAADTSVPDTAADGTEPAADTTATPPTTVAAGAAEEDGGGSGLLVPIAVVGVVVVGVGGFFLYRRRAGGETGAT